MAASLPTVRIAGTTQVCPCHACAFFGSKEEEYAVLLPFMAEGIAAGDKCVNIIDRDDREERLKILSDAGIDAATAARTGQLELRPWEEAHLLGGTFDQHAMLDRLDRNAREAGDAFRLARLWSNQEWLAKGRAGSEDVVEYEGLFNHIWPKHSDITVCVYDTRKYTAAFLIQILCTHPFAIVGGIMTENPFYLPPPPLPDTRPRG